MLYSLFALFISIEKNLANKNRTPIDRYSLFFYSPIYLALSLWLKSTSGSRNKRASRFKVNSPIVFSGISQAILHTGIVFFQHFAFVPSYPSSWPAIPPFILTMKHQQYTFFSIPFNFIFSNIFHPPLHNPD